MFKLEGGHIHRHSPTGMATKTPSRTMEDVDASPVQDALQESGSHTFSEERLSPEDSEAPHNSWSDSARTQADKRRKMNRESARRTRQRKQQQMASLKAEVAALQVLNLRTNARLSAVAEKNKELSGESHKTQLRNQLLMKCVGELTAISKRKEGTIGQLRHCIQHAEKLTDIPLPPAEQVEDQLSTDSLQLLCGPQLQQQTSSRLACVSDTTMPMLATTHVPTPARMHDAITTYMSPSESAVMQTLPKITSFPGNAMPSTLGKSSSLSSIPWGSAQSHNPSSAALLPIHFSNPVAVPGQQFVDPQAHPSQALTSTSPFGMSFKPDCNAAGLYRHPAGVTATGSAARKALMTEVAKAQHSFNPDHEHQLAQLAGQGAVHRAASDSALFGSAAYPNTTMEDILGTAVEWRAQGGYQLQRRPQPSLAPTCQGSHALQIPALDCGQQGVGGHSVSFQEAPMSGRNELMGSGYSNHSNH